jgi:hypothetical protein
MNLEDDLRRLVPPPDGASAPCKACGAPAPPFGVVGFRRAVGQANPPAEAAGPLVQHQRCEDCGLIFTGAFDAWPDEAFQAHVYNADYVQFDPDYVSRRPLSFVELFRRFAPARGEIRMLDYGGGTGLLGAELRKSGFDCETYDPFSKEFGKRPAKRFNLISCIETLEHLPRPRQTLADIARFSEDSVLVVFTTLVQPPDIETQRLNWWYVGPRNGHITFYTNRALAGLWGFRGFQHRPLNANLHLATRNPPAFTSLLFRPSGG